MCSSAPSSVGNAIGSSIDPVIKGLKLACPHTIQQGIRIQPEEPIPPVRIGTVRRCRYVSADHENAHLVFVSGTAVIMDAGRRSGHHGTLGLGRREAGGRDRVGLTMLCR